MKPKFVQPSRWVAFLLLLSLTSWNHKDGWSTLFNGKDLSGWDTYIGPDLDSTGKKLSDQPIGLNKDPRHVFTVVDNNGESVIRISGENWGAITSNKEYENYHLQLRFKWGSLTWGQKKNKKKDSGLLYHCVGRHGADYSAWMRSQEFQIEEGNCGDYWGVAGGMEDIPVTKNAGNEYVYDPSGKMYTFKEGGDVGRHCMKRSDAENTAGKWNTLDLYCFGDTSIHVVNGKVMMVLYQSRQNENGQILPLKKGKIQIQSEGAEVFYKQIKIQPINHLPAMLLQ
ncbi:MAG: DUF1080 domain-containing protein [Bacteroidota bacterium]|nr:DUF1080 domain-containing protein [Bacteroidota bacterium]